MWRNRLLDRLISVSNRLQTRVLKEVERLGQAAGLHRCLRTRDVVGLGLGVTVGAGVFMATGKAAEEAGPATGHERHRLCAFRVGYKTYYVDVCDVLLVPVHAPI